MNSTLSGIIHDREDPELRRHRMEVLEKSRWWQALVALSALAVASLFVKALLDLAFG